MEYVTIIEPRQQGKTSCIRRLRARLTAYCFCYVNLTTLPTVSEANWQRSLRRKLSRGLARGAPLPDGEFTEWLDFFHWAVTSRPGNTRGLVVVLDEIGAAARLEWRQTFFENVRAIYDYREETPEFEKITFLLAGAFDTRQLIPEDSGSSPFNVAQPVRLFDFDADQVAVLVTHLGAPPEQVPPLAERIHFWTDGHPYLTQALCRRLADLRRAPGPADVDATVQQLLLEDRSNLPHVRDVFGHPPFGEYLVKLLDGNRVLFSPHANDDHASLELSGVLKGDPRGFCKVRNRIYEALLRTICCPSEPPPDEKNMAPLMDSYALVVGIANYPRVNPLPASVLQDARDLREVLCSRNYCGYPQDHVRLLLNGEATAEGLRSGLGWLARSAGEDSTAVLFFSGHGGRVKKGRATTHYLIPHDCDPDDLEGTAIPGKELAKMLRKVRARRLLVFFDCCYAGGVGVAKGVADFKSGLEERYYAQLGKGAGRVIMASSRADEVSLVLDDMKNSLFTHHLLDALRGKAATASDGLIRVFEVFTYVSREVPLQGRQQPIFKADDLENNFPIALNQGGKYLRASRSETPATGDRSPKVPTEEVNQTTLHADEKRREIFISYSHADTNFKEDLEKHMSPLRRYGEIRLWSDTDIRPSDDWLMEIEAAMVRAQVAVLLVSKHFLSSDFCTNVELERFVEARSERGLKLVAVIVSDCYWQRVPNIARFQVLPKDRKNAVKPIKSARDKDEAWTAVVKAIAKLLDEEPRKPKPGSLVGGG
jgi:hypothetical protein